MSDPGAHGPNTRWGRQNATAGGSNWLDSNDLERMVWEAGGPDLGRFDALTFILTDVGDIRGTDFSIMAEAPGMEAARVHIAPQVNGAINLVRVLFDRAVTQRDRDARQRAQRRVRHRRPRGLARGGRAAAARGGAASGRSRGARRAAPPPAFRRLNRPERGCAAP